MDCFLHAASSLMSSLPHCQQSSVSWAVNISSVCGSDPAWPRSSPNPSAQSHSQRHQQLVPVWKPQCLTDQASSFGVCFSFFSPLIYFRSYKGRKHPNTHCHQHNVWVRQREAQGTLRVAVGGQLPRWQWWHQGRQWGLLWAVTVQCNLGKKCYKVLLLIGALEMDCGGLAQVTTALKATEGPRRILVCISGSFFCQSEKLMSFILLLQSWQLQANTLCSETLPRALLRLPRPRMWQSHTAWGKRCSWWKAIRVAWLFKCNTSTAWASQSSARNHKSFPKAGGTQVTMWTAWRTSRWWISSNTTIAWKWFLTITC